MKYKVGDKVRIKSIDWYNENKDEDGVVKISTNLFTPGMSQFCGKVVTIEDIFEDTDGDVMYFMKDIYCSWTDEMIEGLVEDEEIEFTEEDKYWCDIMSESDPTTYVLPQGYQFVDENGNVINATKIVLEKKKKEYPKTYEECCEVLEIEGNSLLINTKHITDYERDLGNLIGRLHRLIICRDAYWKIAGDEMGLGKPWEPDYKNENQRKYCIYNRQGDITKGVLYSANAIFAFPTEEMRDAFKENFDPDIEFCKELL